MKISRRKEITDWLNEKNYDIEIKPSQFDVFLQALDEFSKKDKPMLPVVKKSMQDRKKDFAEIVQDKIGTETKNGVFEREDAREFYKFWVEHSPNDKKMRFEKEKSFGIGRRIGTWMLNKLKFAKKDDNRQSVDDVYNNILNFDPTNNQRKLG